MYATYMVITCHIISSAIDISGHKNGNYQSFHNNRNSSFCEYSKRRKVEKEVHSFVVYSFLLTSNNFHQFFVTLTTSQEQLSPFSRSKFSNCKSTNFSASASTRYEHCSLLAYSPGKFGDENSLPLVLKYPPQASVHALK